MGHENAKGLSESAIMTGQGEIQDVMVRRMARSSQVRDTDMYLLLDRLKGETSLSEHGQRCVDDCMSLVADLRNESAMHEDRVAANLRAVQKEGRACIKELHQGLDKVSAMALDMQILQKEFQRKISWLLKQNQECGSVLSKGANKEEGATEQALQGQIYELETQLAQLNQAAQQQREPTKALDRATPSFPISGAQFHSARSVQQDGLNTLISSCQKICSELQDIVSQDILAVPTATHDSESALRSTVLLTTMACMCMRQLATR